MERLQEWKEDQEPRQTLALPPPNVSPSQSYNELPGVGGPGVGGPGVRTTARYAGLIGLHSCEA